MRHLSACGALSALLLLNACSGGAKYPESAPAPSSPQTEVATAMLASAAPSAAPSSPSSDSAKSNPTTPAPSSGPSQPGADSRAKTALASQGEATQNSLLLIYTGDLSMLADEDELASTIDKSIDVAESLGGFLGTRKDASVTLRVPSAHFREAMTKMELLGIVTHRSVTAEDVSEEFHDAEVRLLNMRATRQRMQDFLLKAGTMQDTLVVERELERVAQEIDRLEGRMRFLKSRASFSQIAIALQAKPKNRPIVVTPPNAPPVELPIAWLGELGAPRLMKLH